MPGLLQPRLHRRDGRLVGGDLALAGRLFGQRKLDPFADVGVLHRPRAAQDAGQRVVVAGGDRVELVVVAPGATHALGEKRPAIVSVARHHVHAQLLLVLSSS